MGRLCITRAAGWGLFAAGFLGVSAQAVGAGPVRISFLDAPARPEYGIGRTGFTVECWVRVTSKPGFDPRIVRCVRGLDDIAPDSSKAIWELTICNRSACEPGRPNFVATGQGIEHVLRAENRIDDAVFHHVAVRYDGARLTIFVDGETSGTLAAPGLRVPAAGGRLFVGTATSTMPSFDGLVDELRIWNVGRSDLEIRRDGTRVIDSVPRELVGYWRFDGDGNDRAAGKNHLRTSGHVLFVPGRLGKATSIMNVDPMHGMRSDTDARSVDTPRLSRAAGSTPGADGHEVAPEEWVGAVATPTPILQDDTTGALHRSSGVETVLIARPVQLAHPTMRGAIFGRP